MIYIISIAAVFFLFGRINQYWTLSIIFVSFPIQILQSFGNGYKKFIDSYCLFDTCELEQCPNRLSILFCIVIGYLLFIRSINFVAHNCNKYFFRAFGTQFIDPVFKCIKGTLFSNIINADSHLRILIIFFVPL